MPATTSKAGSTPGEERRRAGSTARRRRRGRPRRRRNDGFRFRLLRRPPRGRVHPRREDRGAIPHRRRNGQRRRPVGLRRGGRRPLLRSRPRLDERRQALRHLDRLPVALRRVLRHHPRHDRRQLRRRRRAPPSQRRRLRRYVRLKDRKNALPRERRGAGQQEIQRTPQAVDVRPHVGAGRVLRLLRRHVGRRPHHRPEPGQVRDRLPLPPRLGQTEIEYLDDMFLLLQAQHQVLRLDVAVDHPLFMGVLQPHRRLGDVMAGVGHRQRPLALHHLVEVLPLDVLHREEQQFAGLDGAVRLHHVVVAEHGGRADLAQEALHHAGFVEQRLVDHLEDFAPVHQHVPGQVDDSHAAAAQLAQHLVAGDQQSRPRPTAAPAPARRATPFRPGPAPAPRGPAWRPPARGPASQHPIRGSGAGSPPARRPARRRGGGPRPGG